MQVIYSAADYERVENLGIVQFIMPSQCTEHAAQEEQRNAQACSSNVEVSVYCMRYHSSRQDEEGINFSEVET